MLNNFHLRNKDFTAYGRVSRYLYGDASSKCNFEHK